MTREIKFRAWTELENEDGTKHMAMLDNDCLLEWTLEDLIDPLDTKTRLMQFTGFYDFLGNSIYSGDILKFQAWNEDGTSLIPVLGQVIFWQEGGGWTIRNPKNETQHTSIHNKCEVIGNIYENPELLK